MLSIESTGSLLTADQRGRLIPAAIAAALSILAGAIPLRAAEVSGEVLPPIRTIRVEGDAEGHAKPDRASIIVAINTHAVTAEQAGRLNATLAENVSTALKLKLGGRGKIETRGYSLYPEYNQHPGSYQSEITGYRAENSIWVETDDTALAGPLVDTALAAGANMINSLELTLKDDTKARTEAIADASKKAQAQAATLAASLGVKLKRVYSATTATELRPAPVAMRAISMSATIATAPTPVEAGEVTVPAHVFLIYEIE